MKNFKLKLIVLSTLSCLASGQAMADWENLPATGVSVGSDTSAYILCNPTGNFGSGSGADAPVQPSSTADECAVMPTSEALAPDSSFTGASRFPVKSLTADIVMNNSYTNNTDINVGTLKEYVWRNASTGMCIYGMKVNLTNTDYNLNAAGVQNFEINDMAHSGWSGKTVDIAYSTVPSNASPTYRAGRTFTAVQHRDEAGYVAQPITGLGSSPAINGVNGALGTTPTAAQQKADIDTDWVDFTTDVNYKDDDGSTNSASGMQYMRTSCSSSTFTTGSDVIRLRQTYQENSGDGVTPNPFIEVEVEGVIPN